MGVNTSVPFKTYVFNIIIGILLFIFGSSAMTIMINKYLNQWRTFWSVFLALAFLIIFGYYKLRQGINEWNKIEELELKKMELVNKKLELEIKILEKEIKKSK